MTEKDKREGEQKRRERRAREREREIEREREKEEGKARLRLKEKRGPQHSRISVRSQPGSKFESKTRSSEVAQHILSCL